MYCQKCGRELDDRAVICPGCGKPTREKKNLFKKWWFWAIAVFLVICIAAGNSGSQQQTSGENVENPQTHRQEETPKQPEVPAEFASQCPVQVSASIYDNIINFPEISCSFKNLTGKEIAAIQLYFVPKDVYGDELNGIFTQNKLYTDTPISANGSFKTAWQLLEQEIKFGDLYVYSVYFADGSEWGDRNATVGTIKKHAVKLSVGN